MVNFTRAQPSELHAMTLTLQEGRTLHTENTSSPFHIGFTASSVDVDLGVNFDPDVTDLDLDQGEGRHGSGIGFLGLFGAALPMVTVATVTLLANGTVLCMFAMTRSLRRCKNVYIASLALADFLIGLTMPVAMAQSLLSDWAPSGGVCKFYLVLRCSLLYVSMLSILLISVDRAWSIHAPFSYRVRQSRRLAGSAVLAIWLLAFLLHTPPILLWDSLAGSAPPTRGRCQLPYRHSFSFLVSTAVLEYLLPLLALWALNASLYLKIARRKSIKIRRSMSASDTFFLTYRKSSSESDCTGAGADENTDLCPPGSNGASARNEFVSPRHENPGCQRPDQVGGRLEPGGQKVNLRRSSVLASSHRRHSLAHAMSRASYPPKDFPRTLGRRRISFDTLVPSPAAAALPGSRRQATSRKLSMGGAGARAGSYSRKQSDDLVRELLVKQDKKAACSLGMLVIVFTLCWTPATVGSVVGSTCVDCLPDLLSLVTAWVLVANSAINPFLYGLLNAEFRKILRQWLNCPDRRRYRVREALLYWNLQLAADSDTCKDNNIFATLHE